MVLETVKPRGELTEAQQEMIEFMFERKVLVVGYNRLLSDPSLNVDDVNSKLVLLGITAEEISDPISSSGRESRTLPPARSSASRRRFLVLFDIFLRFAIILTTALSAVFLLSSE